MATKQHPLKSPGGARRTATTIRLDAQLQKNLALLGQVLKKPVNHLVNEAVKGYLKRSAEVESDLQRILERVRASRRADPNFESAIAAVVDAEAKFGVEDPAEGHTQPSPGPAQTLVHHLIRS